VISITYNDPGSGSVRVGISPNNLQRPWVGISRARMAWADLLGRVWNIDALRCGACSGRMLVVSVVKDPDVIQAILAAILISKEMAAGTSGPRGPPGGGA
jgi:hypothetical protein